MNKIHKLAERAVAVTARSINNVDASDAKQTAGDDTRKSTSYQPLDPHDSRGSGHLARVFGRREPRTMPGREPLNLMLLVALEAERRREAMRLSQHAQVPLQLQLPRESVWFGDELVDPEASVYDVRCMSGKRGRYD